MIPSLLTDSVTYDLERAVHYTLLWGLEGLELRRIGGMHDRVPNVNEHKLKRRLTESELPVLAVGPGVFVGELGDRAAWMNELAQLGDTFGFCRRVGCQRVVVSSFLGDEEASIEQAADALARAGRQAERYEMTVCVINEPGYLAPTGTALGRLLDAVNLDAVQAAWDPTAALEAGEDPVDGLEALGARVAVVRCRNAARAGNGYEPRPIDKGDVDWGAQVRGLSENGFVGPISLVVDVEPVAREGLRGATELIRQLRSTAQEIKP